jgi:predicted O-methyltransferase YrrM
VHRDNHRNVRKIIQLSSISHKYGRVLYSISREFQPKTILELGTGLGISTAYLSKGNPGARIISVEADKGKAAFAERSLSLLQIVPVEIYNGRFDEFLLSKLKRIEHPLMVFIDGDHRYESTMRYFNKILEYKRADSIIVFDDIRWSQEMKKAWNEIKDHSQTILSIDLFFMGIVFFKEGALKQNFMINF